MSGTAGMKLSSSPPTTMMMGYGVESFRASIPKATMKKRSKRKTNSTVAIWLIREFDHSSNGFERGHRLSSQMDLRAQRVETLDGRSPISASLGCQNYFERLATPPSSMDQRKSELVQIAFSNGKKTV